jgi:metallo-beta-lactamase class B
MNVSKTPRAPRFLLLFPVFLLAGMLSAQTPPKPFDPHDVAASAALFESWKKPVEPRRLIGNIYYVGWSGVSSYLIAGTNGHILVDTGFADTVPSLKSNIAKLGFQARDIKWILSSHAHVDHVGGHAAMREWTGAQIAASAGDAHLFETGGDDDFSPFPKKLLAYAPTRVDRVVRDEEVIELGDLRLTAHLTPGHTAGATSWSMDVVEEGRPLRVLFFSSVSVVAGTPLRKNAIYPGIVDAYGETFRKLRAMKCDVFLAPHADQFDLLEKMARLGRKDGPNPFIDPDRLRKVLDFSEASFRRALSAEATR